MISGNRRATASMISLIERGGKDAGSCQKLLQEHTGRAWRIGITGPPGAGKSSLVAELTKIFRSHSKRVGIVAVDPSSPLTKGAVLGDRIRMPELDSDADVFIRSVATRGETTGLSLETSSIGDVLDAAGFDIVMIETTGIGQVEIQVASLVDTTVVVLVPESGDQVQAIKAGMMEIADIYLLNKCDRPGSKTALALLNSALRFERKNTNGWQTKAVGTSASKSEGILSAWEVLHRHRDYLMKNDRLTKRRFVQLEGRIKMKVNEILREDLWSHEREQMLKNTIRDVFNNQTTILDSAESIVSNFRNS